MKNIFSIRLINKSLLLYLFINVLFIFKYASRIATSIAIAAIIFYILLIVLLVNLLMNNQIRINKLKIPYIIYTGGVALVYLLLNIYVDGNSLNVDRWSAMSVGIEALLHGDYPYTAIDHLGGRTSNFPGLFLLGLPSYLLGNIGFLQVFVFILLIWYVYKFFPTNFQRILIVLLFVFSPAYLWEIYTKSDLMSNFILLLIFIDLLRRRNQSELFSTPLITGLVIGILTMTRGVVVLPLIILFFQPFFQKIDKQRIYFLIAIITAIVLLILPIYLTLPAWEIVKEKNPLVLQTSFLPFYFNFIFIIVSILLSYIINKNRIIWWSFVIIFIPVLISAFLLVNRFGIEKALLQSKFDISYFNMSLPFIIFWLGTKFSTNNKVTN